MDRRRCPSSRERAMGCGRRSCMMTVKRALLIAAVAMVLAMAMALGVGAQPAPEPAPPPSNNGVAIDQGGACTLLIVALVVTYLIHPLDAIPYKLF